MNLVLRQFNQIQSIKFVFMLNVDYTNTETVETKQFEIEMLQSLDQAVDPYYLFCSYSI